MPESKSVNKESIPPGERDLLQSFLLSVENFVGQISAESIEAAAKGEQQVLIQATGESLVGQTSKLTAFIRDTAGRLSVPQRFELDKFLQVQDGEALANRGVAVAQQTLAQGVLGKLLHWIAQHLKELKKILKAILQIIFDALHIPLPDWIDAILLIIDEIADLILSLLGEVFGIDFRTTARELSEQEVNFQRERAAFESVRAVVAGRKLLAQDES
jgi:hypothetical protein